MYKLNCTSEPKMTYEIISVRKRKTVKILNPVDIYNAVKRYKNNEQEIFIVITINRHLEIIAIHIATIGIFNYTIIHPREVIKHVFIDNASMVAIAHNHPSGNANPSSEDIKLTEQIIKVSETVGIYVLDHIIFTQENYYSFKQNGKIIN